MKAQTLIRHAKELRRIATRAAQASPVPDHVPDFFYVPGTPAVVGDLPEFTFAKIAACIAADKLAFSLSLWVEQQRR